MRTRNLLIATALLAVLAGLVFWAQKHPNANTPTTDASIPPQPKILDISGADIQEVDISPKGGPTITLKRNSGKWEITAPQKFAADQDAVASLIGNVNPLNGDSVVEEHAANLAQYGLDPSAVDVTIRQKSGKSDTLHFGNDAAVGSLTYATLNAAPKIYAVSTNTKTSLDKSVNDLRDKRLLSFDTAKLKTVDVSSAKGAILFGKNPQGDWQIVEPGPYRADSFQVDELIRKLGDAKMDLSGTPADAQKAASAFENGAPVATVKVLDASGTQTLVVHKLKDDYYAHGSATPGVYKINSDLGAQLAKTVDDYRTKKLFDFGFADLGSITVQNNGRTQSYTRTGTDWKLNGQTQDPGNVQTLIDKLRDLTADQFSTAAFPTPTITIGVATSDGKRTEQVAFAKSGSDYLAKRQNDATVYQVKSATLDEVLKANSDIKPAKK